MEVRRGVASARRVTLAIKSRRDLFSGASIPTRNVWSNAAPPRGQWARVDLKRAAWSSELARPNRNSAIVEAGTDTGQNIRIADEVNQGAAAYSWVWQCGNHRV